MNPNMPDKVRERILNYADRPEPQEFAPGKKGLIIGTLNKALEQFDENGDDVSDINRRLILGWIFLSDDVTMRELSSHDLTPQACNGLYCWIWYDYKELREEFDTEVWWLLGRARTALELSLADETLTMFELRILSAPVVPEFEADGQVAEAIKLGGEVSPQPAEQHEYQAATQPAPQLAIDTSGDFKF